jgi:hypothetical protein
MITDRYDLDVYLQSVNEQIQTTKMSSELWFRSPPANEIRQNDRFVRSLIGEGLSWAISVDQAVQQTTRSDSVSMRNSYWEAAERARDVAVCFGAAGHRTLDEYFTVDPRRSGEAALVRADQAVTASSPADYLLQSIRRLSRVSGTPPAESCRWVMAALARDWPDLVPLRLGQSPPVDAAHPLREFCSSVEVRGAQRRGPECNSQGVSTDNPRALLSETEAREFATTYMLSRYCFTVQEYRMAERLVAVPRLKSALLAAQLHLIAGSRESLGMLLTRFGTPRVLLPFTELFVNRHGYQSSVLELSPNPKLITVLCNNVVPAIAGELLRRGAHVEHLDADVIRAGVVAARRRHVFEIMIALFDRIEGSGPDVGLSGFSMRVCPGLVPFCNFLLDWLPYYFDRFSYPP